MLKNRCPLLNTNGRPEQGYKSDYRIYVLFRRSLVALIQKMCGCLHLVAENETELQRSGCTYCHNHRNFM